MIVDELMPCINDIYQDSSEEEIEIITVKNSRTALEEMDSHSGIDLILVPSNKHADTTYLSINPHSSFKDILEEPHSILERPFSREQLIEFIKTAMK